MDKNTFIKLKLIGTSAVLILALIQGTGVYAQYASRLGRFKVDQIRGCAPFTVTIIDTNVITVGECTGNKPCNMTYEILNGTTNPNSKCLDSNGVPSPIQNCFQYIYTTPGTYTLSVLYQSSNGPDDITITVDPDLKPEFDIYSCNSNGVSVKVTDKTYDQYFIDFGDGSPVIARPSGNNVVAQYAYPINVGTYPNYSIKVRGQKIKGAANCSPNPKSFTAIKALQAVELSTLSSIDKNTLKIDFTPATNIQYKLEIAQNGTTNFQQFQTFYGTGTFTSSAVDLDKNYYCFRLGAYDACTGTSSYSSLACTQLVTLGFKSGENDLTWISNGAGVSDVTIFRNSKNYGVVGYSPTTFIDQFPNIACKTDYSYYLQFNYASGTKSTSLEKTGRSFVALTPNAIADISSVVSPGAVALTWSADPTQDPLLTPNTYTILKSINKSGYVSIGSPASKTLTYTDVAFSEQNSNCYKINYIDACDNKSPDAVETCALLLQGTNDKKNVVTLSWNAYTGWRNGVKTYQLDKFSSEGTLINSTKVTATNFTDDQVDLTNQIVSYRITAIANDGALIPSTSNTIKITKESNLFYPNVFTPNGDNLNDTFIVSGQFISKTDLKIFDRWGGLLYSTEKNEPWNGYLNGKLLNEGGYIWKAIVTDFAGQTFSHSGTIFLLTKQK